MKPTKKRSEPAVSRKGLGSLTKFAIAVAGGVLVLAGIFWANQPDSRPRAAQAQSPSQAQSTVQSTGNYVYQVGQPGPGEMAPPIRLASVEGGTFDLAALKGQTVLLYFQEGVTCQPCWDQLKDIERNLQQFHALGIGTIVSITTDPIDVIKQKVADEQFSTPVLSDPDLAVSRAYDANSYGMMGSTRNGHSFVAVGSDGRIVWRADYGGAPKFTMYLPVATLVADMLRDLEAAQVQQ